MNARLLLLFILLTSPALQPAAGQPAPATPFRTLNVADGLPQSFISGLVQDGTGFIWIGTKDGLARYDGFHFKLFRHAPGDTAGIAGNRISSLFLDHSQQLWIAYETGDIDVLHTRTEALQHLTGERIFKPIRLQLRAGNSVAEDAHGNIWMLCEKGGMFRCNLQQRSLHFFSAMALGLERNKALGIAAYKGNILLATDTALAVLDDSEQTVQRIPYMFNQSHLYDPARPWKSDMIKIRDDGDIIIKDDGRVIQYSALKKSFLVYMLPPGNTAGVFGIASDARGNLYFEHSRAIYRLSSANELSIWRPKSDSLFRGAISMLVDRSGVLWVGGNTTGIQLYDLRLPRMPGLRYVKSFHEDILQHMLRVPAAEIRRSFLPAITPYQFRWTPDNAGGFWILKAGQEASAQPDVLYYRNGYISPMRWHYNDTITTGHTSVNCMAYSCSGKLWGIDFLLHLVSFDTASRSAVVQPYPHVALTDITPAYAVNSLIVDGEDTFWISTSFFGLYRYDRRSNKLRQYIAGDESGSLPTNQLMNMVRDPADPDVFWIGSLGNGLIRFDKTTGRCRIYTTKDGLPNNTVYAVIPDNNGLLWCSSNKGIFSFHPATGTVSSFTTKDGLPGDEFNRYHFLKLPDGRLAFGGVDGYTVFNPSEITTDDFVPDVALTAISINNAAADFGQPGSPLRQAINSLDEIVLPYNQNFLAFEFAALEFNRPEKLRYRYQLEGIDRVWIDAGNEHIATYTSLAPGNYLLKINAANTSGQWSSHIRTLRVIIRPPFWKTWWFIMLCFALATGSGYFLIRRRIAAIRKEAQEKIQFERRAATLQAQALQAQMNPHFIFNCLNSIKALIQEDKRRQAVKYLTSFSKLIRSQLNNAEREISLYDELETCRLYTQMESLRFGDKIACRFQIDEQVNVHALMVPSLILQPFIENAIWHGVLPKGGGIVTIAVTKQHDSIQCTIDDDGIGREISLRNRPQTTGTYESKGMKLALDRMELYRTLYQLDGSIEVIDRKDRHNRPAGTRVIITFKKSHDARPNY